MCIFFRDEVASLGLDEVLSYIKNEAIDRDAWEMADQGLMILYNIRPALTKADSGSSQGSIASKKLV
jgi:hypothetical protein